MNYIFKDLEVNPYQGNAFTEVRFYDSNTLRVLLKEFYELSKTDAPRDAKLSKNMKTLFNLDKADSNNWSDQYHNVKRAIETEILKRIRENNL